MTKHPALLPTYFLVISEGCDCPINSYAPFNAQSKCPLSLLPPTTSGRCPATCSPQAFRRLGAQARLPPDLPLACELLGHKDTVFPTTRSKAPNATPGSQRRLGGLVR